MEISGFWEKLYIYTLNWQFPPPWYSLSKWVSWPFIQAHTHALPTPTILRHANKLAETQSPKDPKFWARLLSFIRNRDQAGGRLGRNSLLAGSNLYDVTSHFQEGLASIPAPSLSTFSYILSSSPLPHFSI